MCWLTFRASLSPSSEQGEILLALTKAFNISTPVNVRLTGVDMLNAVKGLLGGVSGVSSSSEQRVDYGLGESLLISVRAH